MTLIITSSKPLSNPKFFIPNLARDLTASLRMALLGGLADGASVNNVTLTGNGTLRDRTYAYKANSLWSFPTYDADGGADGGGAISFATLQQLANGNGGNTVSEIPQPITRAYRLFVPALPNNTVAQASGFTRAWSGTNLQTIRVEETGKLRCDAGASVQVSGLTIPTERWFTLVTCLNGAESWAMVDGVEAVAFSAGAQSYAGEIFGGNAATTPTATLPYRMDVYDRWSRALRTEEAKLWCGQFAA